MVSEQTIYAAAYLPSIAPPEQANHEPLSLHTQWTQTYDSIRFGNKKDSANRNGTID